MIVADSVCPASLCVDIDFLAAHCACVDLAFIKTCCAPLEFPTIQCAGEDVEYSGVARSSSSSVLSIYKQFIALVGSCSTK